METITTPPEEGETPGLKLPEEIVAEMERLSHMPLCEGCGDGFQ